MEEGCLDVEDDKSGDNSVSDEVDCCVSARPYHEVSESSCLIVDLLNLEVCYMQ